MIKKPIFIALLLLAFACKNEDKKDADIDSNEVPVESNERNVDEESDINRYDNIDNLSDSIDTSKTNSTAGDISGRYSKEGKMDEACSCYCVEVSLTGNSEFCLQPDQIYINVRFEKMGNEYHAFYVSPSSKNKNKDLPWADFSKEDPIAKLNPTNNGLKLDWIGFKIDGKIASDYAIFGKKTLEGDFKKI
ncbi:hypothetical protein [Zunongwangia endophytica]|uniref:DUF4352 domain-containing protein n=1 Tax=Zunongwangia endophytica TaxID=1808945 RepID=A0ABV8H4R9_9FLAO|nr:hypothetical protein [Zunongwangia endophytica]MDN3596539.1 hypothetical protein [Zunongwangia endophytica]